LAPEPEGSSQQMSPVDPDLSKRNNEIILLVLNVGNGWVAGGCWDHEIDSQWIIPVKINSLRNLYAPDSEL
jgi:hypothetical protein